MNADEYVDEKGRGLARSKSDVSVIVDLLGSRDGRAHKPYPNTNLIEAKTIVPQLRGDIPAGVTVLMTAALALPAGVDAEAALVNMPAAPDLAALEARFAHEGVDVSAILVPERF